MLNDRQLNAVRRAGQTFRRLREAAQLKGQDITKRSYELWGESEAISKAQVSKLETGKIDNPPLSLLAKLGYILRLSPNQIAELYEYPWFGGTAPSEDERMVEARTLADSLPAKWRARAYDAMLLAAQNAELRWMQEEKASSAIVL
jgi:transcriptional regulator with XRE-family HTH domain